MKEGKKRGGTDVEYSVKAERENETTVNEGDEEGENNGQEREEMLCGTLKLIN